MGVVPHSPDLHVAKRPSPQFLAFQRALEGRFTLDRELGRGGMGVVFLAWETALNRRVALKVLPASKSTAEARQRFLKEARIAAGLSHKNIVPIYTVDEAGPYIYYAMAYVPGESLYQRVHTRGPFSAGETARILRDVAWAVDYAHQHGVIHRDLKPENILLEEPGDRVLVADFGIARILTEQPFEGGGRTIGTCTYTSPEQAAGLPADERSDIYALGVMGYAMATGEDPFTGPSVTDILEQHISRPAPPLRVLGLHLDTTLSEAVGRCLAKDPEERFQTARELAAALSLAPELSSDLPEPLARFLGSLRLWTQARYLSLFLGFFPLSAMGQAIVDSNWDRAAGAAGILALLLAWPVIPVLHATRRMLDAGYGHGKIIHAMRMDKDRQEKELGIKRSRSFGATVALRIAQSAGVLFGLGFLAALIGPTLPEYPVLFSMIVGGLTAGLAGLAYLGLDFARHHLVGQRWRKFLESHPAGGWWVRLAGLGLKHLPGDPLAVLPPPAAAQLPHPGTGGPKDLRAVVHRTQGCLQRGQAYLVASSSARSLRGRTPTPKEQEFERRLEEKLEQIQAMLDKLSGVDPAAADAGLVTADLEAAQALCDAVDGLIGGREWSL